jgi:hypothetical protein
LNSASGDPPVWQVVQTGADANGEVPVTAWQAAHPAGNGLLKVDAVTPVWFRNGTACGAPDGPWQRVLLKQPGGVPPGAGGLGGPIGEFAPSMWQKAHTVAFPVSVEVCT